MIAKLQMQTIGPKLYSGPIDCAKQIVRANGVVGLWHGFGATILFRSWFGLM
jgi:solute carrier family 25 carnitine/acylcarnitine transporter 20/29